jgi:serine protease Do
MVEPTAPRRRETRLLLATIGVSVGMLLLLARFRFPEETTRPHQEAVQAPLERLAARATYDELAAIMSDLERRVAPSIEVLRLQPERTAGAFVPAPRLTPDRAVILLGADERVVAGTTAAVPLIVGRDSTRELAVVAVAPPKPGEIVTPRAGPPRPGPRYVAVVEATQQGPVIRPVYVGRTDLLHDPRSNAPLLSIAALQQTVSRGAALFALDGQFIGLASDLGGAMSIVPAESLRTLAEQAQQAPPVPGDLGIDVQALTPSLARASGADRGVMVNYVQPRGPAAGVVTSGDVIHAVDGIGITTVGGFQQVESGRSPGKSVVLDVIRNGKPIQLTIRAVEAGVLRASTAEGDPGAALRPIADVGLEVVALNPGGPASRAELQPGDIIVAIDGRPEMNAAALARIFRERPRGSAILLTIRRGTLHRVVALEKP